MKKYMLAAVLSVLLLTAACSKEETKTADAKTSSVLSDSETEASDHARSEEHTSELQSR